MRRMRPGRSIVSMLSFGLALVAAAFAGCSGGASSSTHPQADAPLVTFVELGSDKCVPCIQMRPVMDEIRSSYGGQVRVVFHDVWTDEGAPYARQFRIRVIPTQVFLDAQGREYYRHEGYFPTAEVVKILALQGVKTR